MTINIQYFYVDLKDNQATQKEYQNLKEKYFNLLKKNITEMAIISNLNLNMSKVEVAIRDILLAVLKFFYTSSVNCNLVIYNLTRSDLLKISINGVNGTYGI